MVQLTRLNLWRIFEPDVFRCQIVMALVVALSANCALAEQQFPYVAYITKPDTYVRSGPGQRYYPTQQLPQGHAIEVYRHDGDRWCAVRPPEGSYSIVAAHQVNQLGQGIAEISAKQTVTRVGSLLSPDRSAIQVLLPRGERVKVLELSSTDDARWLKIAPPAGEFRWIAAVDLSPQPPVETTPPPQLTTNWSQQSGAAPTAKQDTTQQVNAFNHLTKSPNILQPTETVAIPSDANAMDIVAGSPAELQLAQFQAQGSGANPSLVESTIPPITGQPLQFEGLNAIGSSPRIRFQGQTAPQTPATPRVAELELRLSEIVIRSPAEWHFVQLKTEATNMLAATDLPGERIRLRNVLERITRFEQVQQGYTQAPLIASQAVSLASAAPISAVVPRAAEAPREEFTGRTSEVLKRVKKDLAGDVAQASKSTRSTSGGEAPLYDAVGILKPVVSKREKAPQYALIDDKGEVVSFVTPTPDLNLQPYLGQRIGVHGTRGYMQEFRRAHVAAARITPIEGRMRR